MKAARATASIPTVRSVPAIAKTPSAKAISASAASSRCAAICLPLAISLSAACASAAPPTGKRARPAGAAAKADRIGVALQHPDLVERQAELFGGELGVGGLVPLARGLRAHQHRQRPRRIEAQFGEFVGRKAGLLDIDGVTEPAVAAARRASARRRGKAGGIGGGERVLHVAGEIAAVVDETERRRIRHRRRRDEIAPAQFGGRDTEAARGEIDQPLERIGRLRPAGAAIGVDRHGVGEDALDRDMDRRHAHRPPLYMTAPAKVGISGAKFDR